MSPIDLPPNLQHQQQVIEQKLKAEEAAKLQKEWAEAEQRRMREEAERRKREMEADMRARALGTNQRF